MTCVDLIRCEATCRIKFQQFSFLDYMPKGIFLPGKTGLVDAISKDPAFCFRVLDPIPETVYNNYAFVYIL